MAELVERREVAARGLGVALRPVEVETSARRAVARQQARRRLGLGRSWLAPQRDESLVALDGDLLLDTGLTEFARRFPRPVHRVRDRRAGHGRARPVAWRCAGCVPSSTPSPASCPAGRTSRSSPTPPRAPRSSMSGRSPASCLAAPGTPTRPSPTSPRSSVVHGLLVVEPTHPDEVGPFSTCCWTITPGSAYVRLTTPPVELGFSWPCAPRTGSGSGTVLRPGTDVTLVGAGPIVLREMWSAAELLRASGLSVGIVAMPWVNAVDDRWWAGVLEPRRTS